MNYPYWGGQVKTVLFCVFLSKIEGERQKKLEWSSSSTRPISVLSFRTGKGSNQKNVARATPPFSRTRTVLKKVPDCGLSPLFCPKNGLFGGSIFSASVASGEKKETPAARKRPCPWNYRAIWPDSKKKERKRKKKKNTYKGNRTHDLWVVVFCDPRPPYTPHPYHIDDGTIFLNKILIYI